MGVVLWQELIATTSTPVNLLHDLHAIELQRITLNMQISLLHTPAGKRRNAPARPRRQTTPTCAGSRPSLPQCAIGDCASHPSTRPSPTRHGYFNHHGDCTMSTQFIGEGNIGSPPSTANSPTAMTILAGCSG